ncbi:MAG: EamA family transporter [Candidatus Omnitrophica bacterium]|nr:EamA family transporter [Candidatus Omnitrophota bacterium]
MNAFWWALLTAGIWGVVPLMEKVGLASVAPNVGLIARSLGVMAGVVVFGALWAPWPALRQAPLGALALLAGGGLLASFIGQLVFYRALKVGAISQVTPVAGAYPLVAALLGWTLLGESITPLRVLGVICVVLGVVLLRR